MGVSALRFEPLGPQHSESRKTFDCGVEALNRYLAEHARKETDFGIARVHVLYDPEYDRIAGFYTLNSCSVKLADLPKDLTRRLPRYPDLPAVLIGRLAADSKYQGRGLGKMLMLDALARIQMQHRQIATFLVVVDAKDEGLAGFYKQFGFQRFIDHERRLYLLTKDIPNLLPS